jgi:hypothetical protein
MARAGAAERSLPAPRPRPAFRSARQPDMPRREPAAPANYTRIDASSGEDQAPARTAQTR